MYTHTYIYHPGIPPVLFQQGSCFVPFWALKAEAEVVEAEREVLRVQGFLLPWRIETIACPLGTESQLRQHQADHSTRQGRD